MADPTILEVTFLDPKGNHLSMDKVTLNIGADSDERTSAPYRFVLKASGKGALSFEKGHYFPYRFQVEVRAGSKGFALLFSKDGIDAPRMEAQIRRISTLEKPGINVLTFEVAPTKEYVFVSGYDYEHAESMFRGIACTRMRDLYGAKHLHPSTVSTIF